MSVLTANLVCTAVFWIAGRLYVVARLRDLTPSSVLVPILLLHGLRHLGLMFRAPGATSAGMPREFAVPAAYGDLLAAVLALIALPGGVARSGLARPLVWTFNVEGTVDLAIAVALATIYDAAPTMGAAYWIPALWVPALLVRTISRSSFSPAIGHVTVRDVRRSGSALRRRKETISCPISRRVMARGCSTSTAAKGHP